MALSRELLRLGGGDSSHGVMYAFNDSRKKYIPLKQNVYGKRKEIISASNQFYTHHIWSLLTSRRYIC